MPYISSERVKEIRNQIRKEFPDYKFSITRDHHSSIYCTILSGPMDFGSPYHQVNHFYIASHWEGHPACEMLLRLKEIMNKGNGVEVEDGDYGTVPNFYINIHIGVWNRPYVNTLIQTPPTYEPVNIHPIYHS